MTFDNSLSETLNLKDIPGMSTKPLIGAIDQGTSSSRFIVFDLSGSVIASHQIEVTRQYPREGWVEQDPEELYQSVAKCLHVVSEKLTSLGYEANQVRCIGVTNQRESTLVWDSVTGAALHPSIVWLDNRTTDLVDLVLDRIPRRDLNYFKRKTGLPISTYFTVFKLKWLIQNNSDVRLALQEGRLRFGTVDSWLLWKLTGHHQTDITNASRTLLMNLDTLDWDPELLKLFDIPRLILPAIRPCSFHYGQILDGPFRGVPITGVIGDQNAALVGQQCFDRGETKVTYGTGCFLIQNLGPGPLSSLWSELQHDAKQKLIVTVGYQLGNQSPCYAVEGSVAIAGAAITWLRDNLNLVRDYDEVEQVARQDDSTGGLYFVPALQGLYAPYWDPNATGTIIGVSQFTRKCHFVRATLEAVAFQANDILQMMDPGRPSIKVDGGMSSNNLLCQLLADISGAEVIRPEVTESTALGTAIVAGSTIKLWSSDVIHNFIQNYDRFEPKIDEKTRGERIDSWRMAVRRSMKWTRVEYREQRKSHYQRLAMLPMMLFVLVSFATHLISKR